MCVEEVDAHQEALCDVEPPVGYRLAAPEAANVLGFLTLFRSIEVQVDCFSNKWLIVAAYVSLFVAGVVEAPQTVVAV